MAKKKDDVAPREIQEVPTQIPDTGLLNAPHTSVPDVVIAEVDFNELLDLEKAVRQTADQFDKIAGNIKRLEKDLDVYHNHEKTLNGQIDAKRKDLIKRYKLDEQRVWKIDMQSRKVVYQQ